MPSTPTDPDKERRDRIFAMWNSQDRARQERESRKLPRAELIPPPQILDRMIQQTLYRLNVLVHNMAKPLNDDPEAAKHLNGFALLASHKLTKLMRWKCGLTEHPASETLLDLAGAKSPAELIRRQKKRGQGKP